MLIRKRYIHPYVNNKIITIAKIWKQCKFSLPDEWIKMWCIYIYCLVIKMKFCYIFDKIDGPRRDDAR